MKKITLCILLVLSTHPLSFKDISLLAGICILLPSSIASIYSGFYEYSHYEHHINKLQKFNHPKMADILKNYPPLNTKTIHASIIGGTLGCFVSCIMGYTIYKSYYHNQKE